MNVKDLIEQLEARFGNPYAPKHYHIVQEAIEKLKRLEHLEKSIVWYQDITMHGTHSEDYENGFWDAVDFVKWHQLEVTQTGHN